MQIHGTLDPTVPYNGDNWTKSIDEVTEYWANFNNCNANPNINDIPNTNLIDKVQLSNTCIIMGIMEVRLNTTKLLVEDTHGPGLASHLLAQTMILKLQLKFGDFFSI